MSDSTVFSLTITNGYVFRQLFDFYSKLATTRNTPIALYLQKDSIVLRLGIKNEKYTLVSNVGIYPEDIESYYINPKLVSQKGEEFCHFELLEPSSDFKMVGKHDKIKLYKVIEDGVQVMYLKSNGSISRLKQSSPVNIDDYRDFISSFDEDAEPDVRPPLSFFSAKFKDISRDRNISHVTLKVSPHTLRLVSIDNCNSEVKTSEWVSEDAELFDEDDEREEYSTDVIIQIAKAVKGLENMSGNGIIKIYSPRDNNIRFSHHIGEYGTHDFYFVKTK